MTKTGERTYSVIQSKDGTYAVQITPHKEITPLTIYGFTTEDEARAWIESEQDKESKAASA